MTLRMFILIFLLSGISSAFPIYDDDIPPPPPVHRSYHLHKHVHVHPHYEYPSYNYGSYGYGSYGSYYPSYGFYPGYGGWSNPLGTGSSWAAGGGLVGNALSFLVG